MLNLLEENISGAEAKAAIDENERWVKIYSQVLMIDSSDELRTQEKLEKYTPEQVHTFKLLIADLKRRIKELKQRV